MENSHFLPPKIVLYEVNFELYDEINVEVWRARSVYVYETVYVTKKANEKWWSRLLKQDGKPPVFLKVDWDKWVDEDEENEHAGVDFDGMDFSKLDMGEDDYDMDESKDEKEEVQAKEEAKIEEEGEQAAMDAQEVQA
ncbi:hypothetical protein IFM89_039525 [Coptis chinensis]|uniref:Co-chaperone protein p23 n=1 Tax=Coptis chinensis TaxID=261450 RepID=A0A835GY04_9MAGN|nr:hypothetical protein IFM89_039525 [Coptis chinensis]